MDSFYKHYLFEEDETANSCQGGLCLSKSMGANPISQRFKDLVVPIGLILENRSTDLHNRFLNMEDGILQPVPEGVFEKFFTILNGQMEKGSNNKSRKKRK